MAYSAPGMIRSYRGKTPQIAASAYIDPSAQIIGDVVIGERSSVWCHTTVRGDVHYIRLGEETNVQDNCCLHVMTGQYPLTLGNRVTVGHSVTLHGCEIEDDCLIGIGAILLNGVKVGTGSVIAAGALVTERTEIPAGSVVMGAPAKVRRAATAADREMIRRHAANYVRYRQTYLEES
jgi:carbonic anhydrase/acetyltransferase-like protein (isoleucine patch superfamily)